MLEYLGFKSWQQQENYLFSRTSRSPPAPTHLPIPAFSLAVKWPGQSDHSHLSRAKFKNQWSYTSTQFALFHGIVGLYLKLILMYISCKRSHSIWSYKGMYISCKRSHSIWSYKGTFLYITYLSHTHYMTHLFHLH